MSDAEVLNALGQQALAQGRPDEALEAFARAILAEPGRAATHVNMAAAHLAKDAAGEAERHARRAIALDPEMALAHHNLGNALFALGDAAAAAQSFARARDLDPDEEAHWSNYLFALSFADAAGRRLAAETRAWGARIEAKLGAIARPAIRDPDPERPLRLAYYLPEFETHVTPRFLAPVLAAHDKNAFQVSVYGARADGAAPPAGLHPEGITWIDIAKMDSPTLAQRMRVDGIDVLIHPCTFKARYRLLLAHRAALLQIAAINLVSSTGLTATDYLFGDAQLTPHSEQPLYTEKLVQLPSFNVYRAPQVAPDVSALPARANGFVTFGSLNNPVKLTDEAVAAWASILNAVPRSRLFLKHRAFEAEEARTRMTARFAAQGVAAERLSFAGFTQDTRAYLAAYHGIDIALDPLPFGGGTTTYEAIWMGVPVLTVAGGVLMGRLSASLMRAIGHTEFVVDSVAQFAPRAAALADDLDRLAAVRSSLRAKAAASIFDAGRFTAALERAVRGAWRGLATAALLMVVVFACAGGVRASDFDAAVAAHAKGTHLAPGQAAGVQVAYPSPHGTLQGFLYRLPDGARHPAMIWLHGSEKLPGSQPELAAFYAAHGFVFFLPHRAGQGRSPGAYIADRQRALCRTTNCEDAVRLQEEANEDVVAAIRWLKQQPFVDPARIVVSGVSFGGIQTLLTAEQDTGVTAFVAFAPAAMSWGNLLLRERLQAAINAARAPVFIIQARNDYNLGPSEVLGRTALAKNPANRAKVYPAFGSSHEQGHAAFGTWDIGTQSWGPDVLAFIDAAWARL